MRKEKNICPVLYILIVSIIFTSCQTLTDTNTESKDAIVLRQVLEEYNELKTKENNMQQNSADIATLRKEIDKLKNNILYLNDSINYLINNINLENTIQASRIDLEQFENISQEIEHINFKIPTLFADVPDTPIVVNTISDAIEQVRAGNKVKYNFGRIYFADYNYIVSDQTLRSYPPQVFLLRERDEAGNKIYDDVPVTGAFGYLNSIKELFSYMNNYSNADTILVFVTGYYSGPKSCFNIDIAYQRAVDICNYLNVENNRIILVPVWSDKNNFGSTARNRCVEFKIVYNNEKLFKQYWEFKNKQSDGSAPLFYECCKDDEQYGNSYFPIYLQGLQRINDNIVKDNQLYKSKEQSIIIP